jgi:glycosyltransferase involved in cell wall biosynthesis
MRRRRVLVIAYYFPPLGMGGVQRIAKFCKYLPDSGWEPLVLTSRPEGYFALDQSLLEELGGVRIFGVPGMVPISAATGERFETGRNRLKKLAAWMLLPDSRVLWVPNALGFGGRLLESLTPDCILASAPPYSSLLVARILAKRSGIPFIADFRDAWLDEPFVSCPTSLHRRINLGLEKRVVSDAAKVISINEQLLSGLRRRHGGKSSKYEILSQGFDPEDFEQAVEGSDRFTVCYTGSFMEARRPDDLFVALSRLLRDGIVDPARVRVDMVGYYPSAFRQMAEKLGIGEIVVFHGYLPHRQSVGHLLAAHVLWLYIAESEGGAVLTGKLFEYLGSRKRIIASVPEGGAAAALIRSLDAGEVVRPGDTDSLKSALAECYRAWSRGGELRGSSESVRIYDRRILSRRLAQILEEVAPAGAGRGRSDSRASGK